MSGPTDQAILAVATPFIKGREALSLSPYPDDGGVPSIGYGSTRYLDGTKVSLTDADISPDQAEQLLASHETEVIDEMRTALTRAPSVNQAAAITSLAYNCGEPSIANSTLVRLFNTGDVEGAADQFLRWDHDCEHGEIVVNPGLLARRQAERALFLSPDQI